MSDEPAEVDDVDEPVDESESEADSNLDSPAEGVEPKRGSNLVYAALGAGALVLALLLLIVWISSRGDDAGDLPLCLDMVAEAASEAVIAGQVESIDVLIDQEQPLKGLTAIQLRMTDGECRRLPEGADNREALYQLLGVVSLYNEAGARQVDVRYLRQDVPSSLMYTSTPVPTETTEPTSTPSATSTSAATATSSPAATLTATPESTPQATPVQTDASPSPVAEDPSASPSVNASPMASPAASPSSAKTATPTA